MIIQHILFELYDNIITFMLSCAKGIEGQQCLNELKAIEILEEHLKKINVMLKDVECLKYIKANVIMVIAYLLKDDKIDSMSKQLSDDFVKTLVDGLRETIENENKNENNLEGTKFYSVYKIGEESDTYVFAYTWLKRLIKVSINNKIKLKLYKFEMFDLLEILLEKGNSKEQKKCCELICSLSFNDVIKADLKQNDNSTMKWILKLLADTKEASVKRYCQQINEIVNDVSLAKPANVQSNKHIMISYNHKYQETIIKINTALENQGYSTWIDINTPINDLYDTMAKAIESASIILICYSQEYKDSGNCRFEAYYAAKLNVEIISIRVQDKYQPDSWLGMILAGKFWIDYSDKNVDITVHHNKLFEQIELINNHKHQIKRTVSKPLALEWDCAQVQNWLIENDLKSFSKIFSNYRGITLNALWDIKQKDIKFFYEMIQDEITQSEIKIETHEKLNFFYLLQNLFFHF